MVGPLDSPDASRRRDPGDAVRSATHGASGRRPDGADIDEHGAGADDATLGDRRAGRFAGARILIVGCGDVGLRLVALLHGRFRVHATTHSPQRCETLRAAGAVPHVVDLDDPRTLHGLGGVAPLVVHLAPPPPHGTRDPRTRALVSALHGVERFVYVSTSGVYGDVGGAWVEETRAVAPRTDRARRRVDAERTLRAWARARRTRLSIVRVPGIYAADRMPLARIEARTPALAAADDVFTNHIHADDLARVLAATVQRGRAQRVYHAVDDNAIRMGDWFDRIADAHGLERPPRVPREAIADAVSPAMLTFLSESRRLSNERMRAELGVRLRYPTVDAMLAAAPHRVQSDDR